MALIYYRTWRLKSEGGGKQTHLEGLHDYTLCGLDTSGDPEVHEKDPVKLPPGKHNVTCEDCKQIIEILREYFTT